MTKDNAKEFIPLVQALADGKTIQRHIGNGAWVDYLPEQSIAFMNDAAGYRIKPEPRNLWVNEYADGFSHAYLTKEEALEKVKLYTCQPIRTIHVREVVS